MAGDLVSPTRRTEAPPLPHTWRSTSVPILADLARIALLAAAIVSGTYSLNAISGAVSPHWHRGFLPAVVGLCSVVACLAARRVLKKHRRAIALLTEESLSWTRDTKDATEFPSPESRGWFVVPLNNLMELEISSDELVLRDRAAKTVRLGNDVLPEPDRNDVAESIHHLRPKLRGVYYGRPGWGVPNDIGDPVAARTRWHHVNNGAAGFRSHKLSELPNGPWAVRRTLGLLLCSTLLFSLGAFGAVAFFWASLSIAWAALPAFGCSSLCWLAAHIWTSQRPTTVDFRREQFRIASIRPSTIPFDSVHALQLVTQWYASCDTAFSSVELCIVLHDGGRVPIINVGAPDFRLQEQTTRLAGILRVPVWELDG